MSEKVVQLKPKACDGLYEIPGVGQLLLQAINDKGRLPKEQAFMVTLPGEKIRRAYYEVAENANHLLRRWFTTPKSYRLDTIVLKRDLTQEHGFTFFLSGNNVGLTNPILSFHVNVHFTPTEELLKISDQVFLPAFPFASSVDKAKEFLKASGRADKICSVETLNQLIFEMEEVAAEFEHKRFGFVTGAPDGKQVIVMGYRYLDPFVEGVANSSIAGFEVDGKRYTSLVEIRLEAILDFVDMDVQNGDAVEGIEQV